MQELNLLRRIEKVDPPPFLLTRIKAKAEVVRKERRWIYTTASVAFVLLVFNIVLLGKEDKAMGSDINELSIELNLTASNHLYDE